MNQSESIIIHYIALPVGRDSRPIIGPERRSRKAFQVVLVLISDGGNPGELKIFGIDSLNDSKMVEMKPNGGFIIYDPE